MYIQVKCFDEAEKLDRYFAVSYFQHGVSNFLLGNFEEALENFNDALLVCSEESLWINF
jgi:tetratricopeptide (TPR) repeat protein